MRLELDRVSMRFGNVVALSDVSFSADAGEVSCLLGDNGAGKSTLIRILSGVYPPSAGSYRIDGQEVRLASPRAAKERGIATVHQDLALIPLMSVWRNFFLGSEPTKGSGPLKHIDVPHCRSVAQQALADLGIIVRDADQPVAMLSGGERQSIAIARAVHHGARMLILDEPTAALGVKQAAVVLRNITQAKQRGVGVVLVTHNPVHAYDVGDRLVVLQQGRLVGSYTRDEITVDRLARLMSGM